MYLDTSTLGSRSFICKNNIIIMKITKLNLQRQLFFLSVLIFFTQAVFSQNLIINHVIVIDATGSMKGQGSGSQNIWDEVKSSIGNYIKDINEGENIIIYTYGASKIGPKTYNNITATDRINAISFVNSLDAKEEKTCTYKALCEIYNEAIMDSSKITLISLYTDAIDNCGGPKIDDVIKEFNMRRGPFDHTFFITLGKDFLIPDDPNFHGWSTSPGKVITPIIISPRAQSLNFSIDDTVLNQGYNIYGENFLSDTVYLKIIKTEITGLTGTHWDPEILPKEHLLEKDKTVRLSFKKLNNTLPPLQNYKGYYQYEGMPDRSKFIYVIPDKVNIFYSNVAIPAELTIDFPDNIEKTKIMQGDTILGFLILSFNKKSIDKNIELVFNMDIDRENLGIEFSQGEVDNYIWKINAAEYVEMDQNGNKGVKVKIFAKKGANETSYSSVISLKGCSNILKLEDVIYTDDQRSWEIKKLSVYSPFKTWEKILYYSLGLLILGLLIWFVFLRRKLFPVMTGTLNFTGENLVKLNGTYIYYLYTKNAPKEAKQGIFSKLFIGTVGKKKIETWPDAKRDDKQIMIIKPLKTPRGLRNRIEIPADSDLVLSSGAKDLYHEQKYTVTNKEKDAQLIFIYNNSQHKPSHN